MAWAALAATVAGVMAGGRLPAGPGHGTLAVAVLAAVAAWGWRPARAPLLVHALGALATTLTLRAWDGLGAPPDEPAAPVTVELVGDPVPSAFRTRAVARLHGRHVLLEADRPFSSHLAVVDAGDRLTVSGRSEPLTPGDALRWRHRHVASRFVVDDVVGLTGPPPPLFTVANRVRATVLAGTTTLPAPERGLVAGLLVGDTRAVPEALLDDFRAAGLSHLLAVSGANVAVVLSAVAPLLRRLERRARFAGTLAALLVFAAVTRFEPSVLRASGMAALAAWAWVAGRPASGLRLLVLASAGLLLLDPFLLDSLGFRLSCAASAGILVLARPLARRLPEPLAVTLAAQLGVVPVLVPALGPPPLVALPANLLAVPLAAPLTVWGLASGPLSALLDPLVPGAAVALQAPTFLLARLLALVARAAAAVPLP